MLTVIFVMAMAGQSSAPKSARDEGGNPLLSRIEPSAPRRPPAGAQAIPPKNPKAPLPARRSQPDALEAAADYEILEPEPEPLDDHALVTIRQPSLGALPQPPRGVAFGDSGPSLSTSGAEDAETAAALPKDFTQALANLQQRQSAPPPSVPRPSTRSAGESGAYESQRNNSGPSTHRIESPRRVASVPPVREKDIPSAKDLAKGVTRAAPTPSTAPPPVDATMPLANGSGPSLLQSLIIAPGPSSTTAPLANPSNNSGGLNLKPGTGAQLNPMRAPSPMAIVGGASLRINSPGTPVPISPSRPNVGDAGGMTKPYQVPSRASTPPPPAASSRPATSPKSFPPPAGGPPVQYERAFRQWSSPGAMGGQQQAADDSANPMTAGAVSFQVYTPRDVASGRGPMRSLPMIDTTEVKKPSIGVRIGMSIIGGIVVILTAAAVIAVSTEDPKKPVPAATTAKPAPPPVVTVEPPPVLTIGDPPIDELPPTTTTTTTPAATAKQPKAKPAAAAPGGGGGGNPNPPSSLKGIAPPPNPYGNK